MIIMKKIILLSILIIIVISCTAEDRAIMRKVDKEWEERGVECLYNHKGELIGSCNYIN